ncbi:MAG: hypothetical protein V4546_16935 [Bacteroidota bacterium]
MSNRNDKHTAQTSPKDGLDNTGTQGYDTLSDDAYTGKVKTTVETSNNPDQQIPVTINSPEMEGEKIIFDLLINQKLAHIIVRKNGINFHINIDGEDVGRFEIENHGKINRFPQPRGARTDDDVYFSPVEEKLKALGKLG